MTLAAMLALLASCGDKPQANNAVEGASVPPAEVKPVVADVPPAPTPEPVFTSLARADCTLVEEKREEAGYARFICPGRGEYRLELVEADGREDLALRRGSGAPRSLQLPSRVAKGAFSKLGETAQWVGTDRLIVRYEVEQTEGRPALSSLVVIDLPAACPVAVVPPGSGQNEEALRKAEGSSDCIRD